MRQMPPLARLRSKAREIKVETFALYLALRDPRTPWYARALAALVVGYAFSPIDLIPDFVPILGHLDDLVLLPLGVWLTARLIPPQVLADARAQAEFQSRQPTSWVDPKGFRNP